MAETLTELAKRLQPYLLKVSRSVVSQVVSASEGPGIDIAGTTIGLGGDTILLYDSAGAPVAEFAATDSGLTAALAAATSGQVVWLPAGVIVGDFTIPIGVHLQGLSIKKTSIQGTVTLTPDAVISSLTILKTAADANDIQGVYTDMDAGEEAYIYSADVIARQDGSGDAAGLQIDGDGYVYAYQTRLVGASLTGSSYGCSVEVGASGRVYQYNGICQGGTSPYSDNRCFTALVELSTPALNYVAPGVTITRVTPGGEGGPPNWGLWGDTLVEWVAETNNWGDDAQLLFAGCDSYLGDVEVTVKLIAGWPLIGTWYPPATIKLNTTNGSLPDPELHNSIGDDGELLPGETAVITAQRSNLNGYMGLVYGPAHSHLHFKVSQIRFGSTVIYSSYGA